FTSFDSGSGAFLEGKVVDMFYFPLFTWPESIPLVGGRVFFSAIFNFADAAITCGVIAMLLFYSRSLFSSDKNSDKSETKTEEKIETN
ncbi:MAG: signal peptidase II, partial [Bacteroidaceae bacterium]|nr:signal peptidase II [Bacteroidaceae bacterium]